MPSRVIGNEVESKVMPVNWREWLTLSEAAFAEQISALHDAIHAENDSFRYRTFNRLAAKLFQLRQLVNAYAAAGGKVEGENGVAKQLRIRPNTVYQRIKLVGLQPQDLQRGDGFLALVGRSSTISEMLDELAGTSSLGQVAPRVANDASETGLWESGFNPAGSLLNSLKSFSDRVFSVAREALRETQAGVRVHAFCTVIGELYYENRFRFSRQFFPHRCSASKEYKNLQHTLRETEQTLKDEWHILSDESENSLEVLKGVGDQLSDAAAKLISATDQFAASVRSLGVSYLDEHLDPDSFWAKIEAHVDELMDASNNLNGCWDGSNGDRTLRLIWRLCEEVQDEQMQCGSLNQRLFVRGANLLAKFVHILDGVLSDESLSLPNDTRELIEGVRNRSVDRADDLRYLCSRIPYYLHSELRAAAVS